MKGAASERSLSARHSSQATSAVTIGTGARNAMFGQENQRCAISACWIGVHRLTTPTAMRTPAKAKRPEPPGPVLEGAFGLQDEPARAEQRVAEHQRDAGHQRERGEAVERTAGKLAPVGLKALDEGAEHDALRKGAERRAVAERIVPERAALGVPVAELERDAAKDQREQHDDDREIDRRQDDGEGERERREQRRRRRAPARSRCRPRPARSSSSPDCAPRDRARSRRGCRRRDRSRRAARRERRRCRG